ncbi:MAG: N-acetylmuramic acid 6-phosphate etherase [Gemmatimonadota bacterium]
MADWAALLTEQRNPATEGIDEVDTLELVRLLNREDARVAPAVEKVLPEVARAVDLVAAALGRGGRLLYLGAGTSGRLGILDASECPPTFSADPEMVQGLIAGGPGAVFRAVEGAEDDPGGAIPELEKRGLKAADVVAGIAASGVTPYVVGGLSHARQKGCSTILISCSPSGAASVTADVKIVPEVGPEAITGSTRMKAGTGTKMVLNMVTTGAMIRLGKTFGNLMVDLQPTNAKLRDRTIRILAALTGLERQAAALRVQEAGGSLKHALVMQLCSVSRAEAQSLLQAHQGRAKAAAMAHRRVAGVGP